MYSWITRPLALPLLSDCLCLSLLLLTLFSFQILFFPVQTLYFPLKFLLVHGLGASGLTSVHPLCGYSHSPWTRFLATLWVPWLPAQFMFISCGPISDQYPPSQYFVRLLVPWTSTRALFILPGVHRALFPLEGRLEEKEGNETWDQWVGLTVAICLWCWCLRSLIPSGPSVVEYTELTLMSDVLAGRAGEGAAPVSKSEACTQLFSLQNNSLPTGCSVFQVGKSCPPKRLTFATLPLRLHA